VTTIDPVDATVVGDPIVVIGNTGGLVVSGTRGYLTTYAQDPDTLAYSTTVTAFDASDGTLVGEPITVDGVPNGGVRLTADGTRAYLTTSVYDPDTNSTSTLVTVIDTGTSVV
jgi:hypothetical protein